MLKCHFPSKVKNYIEDQAILSRVMCIYSVPVQTGHLLEGLVLGNSLSTQHFLPILKGHLSAVKASAKNMTLCYILF